MNSEGRKKLATKKPKQQDYLWWAIAGIFLVMAVISLLPGHSALINAVELLLGVILGFLLTEKFLQFMERQLTSQSAKGRVWQSLYWLYGGLIAATQLLLIVAVSIIDGWKSENYHPMFAVVVLAAVFIGWVFYLVISAVSFIHDSFKALGQKNGWLWGIFAVFCPYFIGLIITFFVARKRLSDKHLWK